MRFEKTLLFFFLISCQIPNISVIGSGDPNIKGFQDGDGGVARFDQPIIAYSKGAFKGLFIADTENHRIRFIDSDGKVTTFSGSGGVNLENIQSGEISGRFSPIYLPSSIFIYEDKLNFTSPGCIRTIDLNNPDLGIKTTKGMCLTPNNLKDIKNGVLDEITKISIDPYNWVDLKDILIDENENIFVSTLNNVYRIEKNGHVTKIEAYFQNLKGIVSGLDKNPYIIHDNDPLPPLGPIDQISAHEVTEILPDNKTRLVTKLNFWISAVSNNKDGNILFATNNKLYQFGQDFKPSLVADFSNKSLESVRSISCENERSVFYLSDYTSVYKLNLNN